ncbi:MAG: hypothetical protein HFH14_06950, partial [Lachnospiraceae bacterium]|nr:hypothetical protein [Lachnospiraceae bacterium]
MNVIFMVYFIFLISILAGCIVITRKTKTEFSFAISVLLALTICMVSFYSTSLRAPRLHTGLLMLGLYFTCFYWLVIIMFYYAVLLTGYKTPVRYVWVIAAVFGVIDTMAMVLNTAGEFMFTLEPSYNGEGAFYCWLVRYKTPNYLHD